MFELTQLPNGNMIRGAASYKFATEQEAQEFLAEARSSGRARVFGSAFTAS
jgi:hypothetical protein